MKSSHKTVLFFWRHRVWLHFLLSIYGGVALLFFLEVPLLVFANPIRSYIILLLGVTLGTSAFLGFGSSKTRISFSMIYFLIFGFLPLMAFKVLEAFYVFEYLSQVIWFGFISGSVYLYLEGLRAWSSVQEAKWQISLECIGLSCGFLLFPTIWQLSMTALNLAWLVAFSSLIFAALALVIINTSGIHAK